MDCWVSMSKYVRTTGTNNTLIALSKFKINSQFRRQDIVHLQTAGFFTPDDFQFHCGLRPEPSESNEMPL